MGGLLIYAIAILSSVFLCGVHGSSHRIQAGVDPDDHCVAVVRTRPDPNKKFYGAGGSPTIYKPTVQDSQWSAARMKLSNGPDSIEVGWMYVVEECGAWRILLLALPILYPPHWVLGFRVNPNLFHDNETHQYVRFTAGQTSCINTQCPGFVYVGKDVPLDQTPQDYSRLGTSDQYYWKYWIDKHQDDGHWWLSMDDDKYQIGYWPKSLFTGLAEAANQVEWGGEIDNPGAVTPMPGMGAGVRPVYDTRWSAIFEQATVVDQGYHNIDPPDTEKFMTCHAYGVLDSSYTGEVFGRIILYGGPSIRRI